MSQALTLFRLQQIDNSIARAQARSDAIRAILDDDSSVRQAREMSESSAAALKAAEDAMEKAEIEVQNLRIKIEQTEASLYGGSVRNPKELRDLQEEAAALKRYLSTLEDRLLESMLVVEETQEQNKKVQSSYSSLNLGRTSENETLILEESRLRQEIQKLTTERLAITESLDIASTELYEKLRAQRRGVAVTVVEDNTCTSCGTTLTPALVQAAHSPNALSHCPTCARILFAN